MNESPWDNLDIKAESDMEQSETAQYNLAISLTQFFSILVSQGMTREESLVLTCKYLENLFAMQHGRNDG